MHIVIIEDEQGIRQELSQLLRDALYEVTAIESFERISEKVLELQPDLVLLDLNLPGISGFEVCGEIRKHSEVPIIFVTSRTDAMDELTGMVKGGDDYITKPFYPPVLLAHIAAVLKRTRKKEEETPRLFHKGVELDFARGCIGYGDKQQELSKNEMKILHFLFLKKGEITPRMDLIEYLWDHEVYIDDNTLSVNITRIRAKLEQIGVRDFIETKRGMGYRMKKHFWKK